MIRKGYGYLVGRENIKIKDEVFVFLRYLEKEIGMNVLIRVVKI